MLTHTHTHTNQGVINDRPPRVWLVRPLARRANLYVCKQFARTPKRNAIHGKPADAESGCCDIGDIDLDLSVVRAREINISLGARNHSASLGANIRRRLPCNSSGSRRNNNRLALEQYLIGGSGGGRRAAGGRTLVVWSRRANDIGPRPIASR